MIPDSPYKGLVPFEDSEVDALLFFGRERESEIIAENILAARLTVLYGPSGVGKTSVLRAGVAHRLRRQARLNVEERGHPEYAVVVFDAWSEDPVESLRAAARGELAAQFGSALLDEREDESLADTLGRWTEALACELLVVLDQAEEYFLYHRDDAGFSMALPDLATRPGLRVRVLLSLRDDALSKLDRFKGRIPNLFANYLRLDHLDRRAAGEAVVKPVERYNQLTGESIEVEPELTEAVLDQAAAGQVDLGAAGRGLAADDVSAGRVEAAYLQLVLERIWAEERDAGSSRLRAETLLRLGGAESIVRAHLRRAVEELSSEERDVAADVFRFLVTPSGTKVAHGVGDLAEYVSVEEQRLLPVLSTLGRERIVRTVDGAGAEGTRYEIFHDVLGEAVLAWRREQELARERRAAERRHRRLATVAVGALLALAAMTAVAIYALSQRSDARTSARSARSSARSARARELAALAQSALATDPLRSVDVARRAAELESTPVIEDVLRKALAESRVRLVLSADRKRLNAAHYSPDGLRVVTASDDGFARIYSASVGQEVARLRHGGVVTDAAFSADGRVLATASRDGTARIWTSDGRPLQRPLRHGAPVLGLALSPDAGVLVTIAGDATVHVWRLTGGRRPLVFHEPTTPRRVVMSSDGRLAAVVGGDRVARVYDVVAGRLLFSLPHESKVLSAAFGLHGTLLVTGSADNSASVWDLRYGSRAYRFKRHYGEVVDVDVGPNGGWVATASADGTARVWDIGSANGVLLSQFRHENAVTSVSLSRGALFTVTTARDGTARVWTTKRGTPLAVLAGHDGPVLGAEFSRTSRRVLTYGEDGTARIWDPGVTPELRVLYRQSGPITSLDVMPDGSRLLAGGTRGAALLSTKGHVVGTLLQRRVRAVRFAPNGRMAATAGSDGVRIWTADGQLRQTLPDSVGVSAVAFDPSKERLATAGPGRTIRLWRLGAGAPEPTTFEIPHGRAATLAFSPDGNQLATGGTDGRVRLWTLSSRRQRILGEHRGSVASVSFSPDGRKLVTASVDEDPRIWNLERGRSRSRALTGQLATVSNARFSADGRWVVTAGHGTAGLWEVRSARLLVRLRGHIGMLHAAVFAPRGYTLYTAGEDGSLRKYTCEVCGPIRDLRALAARRLQAGRPR